MKNKLMRSAVAVGLALSFMTANIAPAQAYTVTQCRYSYAPNVTVYECYRDYNWWETAFLAKKDGWYPVKMWWR